MSTCLITGASGGIGYGIALKFAKAGYNLVLNYHKNQDGINNLTQELDKLNAKYITVKADVSKEEEIIKMKETAEKAFCFVDTVVCNSGVSLIKQINDTTEEDYEYLTGVNLKGVYFTAKTFAMPMISNKYGRIINISSMWGVCGASCETLYSASKGGVIAFTKALAKELAPSNITVNCICPGVIDTEMNKHLGEETLKELAKDTPIGRLGTVEDIANAVEFFAKKESSFITGQILTVDGGFSW